MTVNQKWINKGRREQKDAVVAQGKVLLQLAQDHAVALDAAGWKAQDTAILAQRIAALEQRSAGRSGDKGQAQDARLTEGQAIERAQRFIRRLRNALPKVLRQAKVPGVGERSFVSNGRLGRSAARLSSYLNDISVPVARLDDLLEPYFEDKKPSEELVRIRQNLDQAGTHQEVTHGALPLVTLNLNTAKGGLLESIEDLIRIGRNAYENEPEKAAQFNKDILRRSRRPRPAKEEQPEEPAAKRQRMKEKLAAKREQQRAVAEKAPAPLRPELVARAQEESPTEEDISIH